MLSISNSKRGHISQLRGLHLADPHSQGFVHAKWDLGCRQRVIPCAADQRNNKDKVENIKNKKPRFPKWHGVIFNKGKQISPKNSRYLRGPNRLISLNNILMILLNLCTAFFVYLTVRMAYHLWFAYFFLLFHFFYHLLLSSGRSIVGSIIFWNENF